MWILVNLFDFCEFVGSVTDYLQKRGREKFEKEESAKKKKEG